jgi:hypothetical protein
MGNKTSKKNDISRTKDEIVQHCPTIKLDKERIKAVPATKKRLTPFRVKSKN